MKIVTPRARRVSSVLSKSSTTIPTLTIPWTSMLSLYQRSLAATSDTEIANADPARANAGALGGGDCCAAEMDGAITQSTRATVLIAVCSRVWLRDGSLRE